MATQKKSLTLEKKNGFDLLTEKEKKQVFSFSDDYCAFMKISKTEREFCTNSRILLEQNGFQPLEEKKSLKPGDKVYSVNRGKGIYAAVIGTDAPETGVNILAAHIDSPRLDLKPHPLSEDSEIAYFKTHYYGGIKKYQWTTIPLALHGVVALQDGTQIQITIGEDESDPVFCITDLLPHLAAKQMAKKLSEAIEGESLKIIIGNIASKEKDADNAVKYNILQILNQKYDITEEDFTSGELEIVPAFPPRDIGLDRSMVGAYGHDDRVCAYTALRALLDMKKPQRTSVCCLVDKEEIGSMGVTGMKSGFFRYFIFNLCNKVSGMTSDLSFLECLHNSAALSADVDAAFDPLYAEVSEKQNAVYLNHGIAIAKYTGSRGKSGGSDASAELLAKLRRIFNDNKVFWQIGELGKVDAGGGGTVAQYIANLDIDVADAGVPVLNMHAPYEIVGKSDVYMAYKAYCAFLTDCN